MLEHIDEKRRRELKLVMKNKLWQLVMFNIGGLLPTLGMVVSLMTYVSMDSYCQTDCIKLITPHGRRSS